MARRRCLILVGLLACAPVLGAQAPATPPIGIEIHVRDSAGVALAGVDVAVVHGLSDNLAAAQTDTRGVARLRFVPTGVGVDELVIRKVGYLRVDRYLGTPRDSLTLDITLQRAPATLDPVVVTAEQDVKRKSYHIDADEIAKSDRQIVTAADILAKLRPDMICGRNCSPMAGAIKRVQTPMRACPSLAFLDVRRSCPKDDTPPSIETNVWVNGRRIRTVLLDENALAHQTGLLGGLSPGTMTVLSEIKPEHIAEMTYVDEFDNTVGKVGSNNALFIVLKPGVQYEPGAPSFVSEKAIAEADSAAAHRPTVLPPYRYRLIGVFDAATGDPVDSARVIDMSNGSYMRTSATGTASLVFLGEGSTPVRIARPGFADLDLVIDIGPSTTQPLTLILQRQPAP